MDAAQILEIIQRGKGSFFDPDVVDTFMNVYQTGKICEAFQCLDCMDRQTA